jgi:hypothetical protein
VTRALAERLGWARFVEQLGATQVDQWIDPETQLSYELMDATLGGERARFIRKQSSILKDASQPYYLEPVPRECASAQSARKWQAMAAFLAEGDARGGMELAHHCNKHPELTYAFEA